MSTRNWIAVGLTIVSLVLLVPGLRSDALTITATVPLFKKPIFEETQSILRAARRLYDSRNYFVAGLVVFFSVVVPFFKAMLLIGIFAARSQAARHRLYLFTRSISKWAMADVFAVGVFIAFLAGNALDQMDARLHPGYYYFVAYCLVSNLAFQFLYIDPPPAGGGYVSSAGSTVDTSRA